MSIDIFKKSFEFKKTTQAKKQVFGIAYPSNRIDSQGEFTDSVELEKAVQRVAELDDWPRIVDVQHDTQRTESKVIESYIATTNGDYFKKGDWLARIQVSDSEWPRVENGELKAFSIYGKASRETVTFQNRQVQKMTDIRPSLISLVKTGASRQSFVAKSNEAPAWFNKWAKQMETRIALLTKSDDDAETGEPGDFVRKSDGWYQIARDGDTHIKQDLDMNKRLELAHRQRDDRLKKNDDDLSEHLRYVHLLEMVTGDGPAADRERAGYAAMAAQHGGADRVWRDAFNISKGGDAYSQRNRNNPLHQYLAGWKGEKVPGKVVQKTPQEVEKSNQERRDEAFIERMTSR